MEGGNNKNWSRDQRNLEQKINWKKSKNPKADSLKRSMQLTNVLLG